MTRPVLAAPRRVAQLALLTAALLLGCTRNKPGAPGDDPGALLAPAGPSALTDGEAQKRPGEPREPPALAYPLGSIRPVADGCKEPTVLLATGAAGERRDLPFRFMQQALLAHPEFRPVEGPAPLASMQIAFRSHEYGPPEDGKRRARALVGSCGDAGTCNRLAAMYKAVIRSSSPQPACGRPPGIEAGPGEPVLYQAHGAPGDLPHEGDLPALCGRVAACEIIYDRATPGDPGPECLRHPERFGTDCARKPSCAEVVQCLRTSGALGP